MALGQIKSLTRMAGEYTDIMAAVDSNFQSHFRVGDRVYAFDATSYAS